MKSWCSNSRLAEAEELGGADEQQLRAAATAADGGGVGDSLFSDSAAGAGRLRNRENPLQLAAFLTYNPGMERTVHKARTFRAAAAWDIQQQVRMTPRERWLAARQLRERVFGRHPKDVRACHATN